MHQDLTLLCHASNTNAHVLEVRQPCSWNALVGVGLHHHSSSLGRTQEPLLTCLDGDLSILCSFGYFPEPAAALSRKARATPHAAAHQSV